MDEPAMNASDRREKSSCISDLQTSVDQGLRLLAILDEQLKAHTCLDAQQWTKDINAVRVASQKSKVMIGIIGATGAGKSALINALLEQERILPTNCMRACTAVVTEISYNESEIAYRAEIEFVSRENWHAELSLLFSDLIDHQGKISSDCNNEDSAAGMAYSKLRAIYPKTTKEQLLKTSVDELMSHQSVAHLGTTLVIEHNDLSRFYPMLQQYIDSREKTDFRRLTTKDTTDVLEYWPLIRVVRLFVKAPILQTGAILVDLPGIHDSNVARGAIALNYHKECSALLIVSPITRAVDDRAAKTLLGQTFRQQVKLDGTYGNITFVCSKTDDITLTEAHDTLELGGQTVELYSRLHALQALTIESAEEHQSLVSSFEKTRTALEKVDAETDLYYRLRRQCESGMQVYRPTTSDSPNKRRKSSSDSDRVCKKQRNSLENLDWDSEDSEDVVSDDEANDFPPLTNMSEAELSTAPLTRNDIDLAVDLLNTEKKELKEKLGTMRAKIKECEQSQKSRKRESNKIHSQLYRIAIIARNDYSRAAIKSDFAAGMKELDQELAFEADPENFDPDSELRDYQKVADDLPVFCVSSRGYQKLQGRLKKEQPARGLISVDDTEVSALQAHCLVMTDDARAAAYDNFLKRLERLVNSLHLWISGVDETQDISQAQIVHVKVAMLAEAGKLTEALDDHGQYIMNQINNVVSTEIFDNSERAVRAARDQAIVISTNWSMPVSRDDSMSISLAWNTYRATVKRDGMFAKKTVVHDFNRDLVDPLMKGVAHRWEQVFTRIIPDTLKAESRRFGELLADFHHAISALACDHGARHDALVLLQQQSSGYQHQLKQLTVDARSSIKKAAKNANREFIVVVGDAMRDTYANCAAQSGHGMFLKMKNLMKDGVQETKAEMFDLAVEHARGVLQQSLDTITEKFLESISDTAGNIRRDYMQLVADRSQQMLEEQAQLRASISGVIQTWQARSAMSANNSTIRDGGDTSALIAQTESIVLDPAELHPASQTHGASTGDADTTRQDVRKSNASELSAAYVEQSSMLPHLTLQDWTLR